MVKWIYGAVGLGFLALVLVKTGLWQIVVGAIVLVLLYVVYRFVVTMSSTAIASTSAAAGEALDKLPGKKARSFLGDLLGIYFLLFLVAMGIVGWLVLPAYGVESIPSIEPAETRQLIWALALVIPLPLAFLLAIPFHRWRTSDSGTKAAGDNPVTPGGMDGPSAPKDG